MNDNLDRAIEAAAKALFPRHTEWGNTEVARIAVEAAAPHLPASEGLLAAHIYQKQRAERAEAEVERLHEVEDSANVVAANWYAERALADRLAEALATATPWSDRDDDARAAALVAWEEARRG